MIFQGLSVWIQTPGEDQLPEYETNVLDKNTIECWIPSTEGSNFEIAFKSLERSKNELVLNCRPQLDGINFPGRVLPAKDIARGMHNTIEGQAIDTSTVRLFSFGKRLLTDREDIAPSKKKPRKDLNVIRVTLEWGLVGKPKLQSRFKHSRENGPIHEKAAKKGHTGSVGLGKFAEIDYRPTTISFKRTRQLPLVVFIFHYGPEDWLQAKEIIPSESSSQKRVRNPTPEQVDVDELETDDDEITVIRHMIPIPVAFNNKRRRIGGEDMLPKLES